jgi:signal transduction histidine kinase
MGDKPANFEHQAQTASGFGATAFALAAFVIDQMHYQLWGPFVDFLGFIALAFGLVWLVLTIDLIRKWLRSKEDALTAFKAWIADQLTYLRAAQITAAVIVLVAMAISVAVSRFIWPVTIIKTLTVVQVKTVETPVSPATSPLWLNPPTDSIPSSLFAASQKHIGFLSDTNIATFKESIRGTESKSYQIDADYNASCAGCYDYSKQISRLLADAGWKVNWKRDSAADAAFNNLFEYIQRPSVEIYCQVPLLLSTYPPAANALVIAFGTIGVSVPISTPPFTYPVAADCELYIRGS